MSILLFAANFLLTNHIPEICWRFASHEQIRPVENRIYNSSNHWLTQNSSFHFYFSDTKSFEKILNNLKEVFRFISVNKVTNPLDHFKLSFRKHFSYFVHVNIAIKRRTKNWRAGGLNKTKIWINRWGHQQLIYSCSQ